MAENTKKIHSLLIIDVMGAPKEYLNETLKNIIESIKKEKGVKILESHINEPKEIEEKKGFFTNFSEIEVETDSISTLSLLMFRYMPAHLEVIYPEDIVLKNHVLNDVMNELVRRLHGYDNLARIFQYEKSQMIDEINRLRNLTENKTEILKDKAPISISKKPAKK